MKNIFRKLAFILIILCLVIISSCRGGVTTTNATITPKYYTALGDSIATGYGVPKEKAYTDLFYDYLKTKRGYTSLEFHNMSTNGDDSSNLLKKLKEDENVINSVKQSDLITICIGGNNILMPLIHTLGEAAGVDASSPDFESRLQNVFNEDADSVSSAAGILKLGGLSASLQEGIARFENDWPEIINTVKSLAPQAQILVMNVYNPLKKSDFLHGFTDTPIQKINNVISKPSPFYRTVDVYSAFENYNADAPLTNCNVLRGSFDPHPTIEGHNTIFNSYCEAYKLIEEQYSQLIKRGEAISIIIKALKIQADFSDNFMDVNKDSQFYNYIGIAKKLGIVDGKGHNKFYPEEYITREEAMVIIEKSITFAGKNLFKGNAGDISGFDDESSVSAFAADSIASLYKSGMLSFSGNKICPKDKMAYYDYMNIIYSIPQ